ncbi:MAG TPA: hypothetical protein VFB06_00295 [Streptosporangiaceae bacterium]|nr:hypothetical protein [Streptosporangiaceae bacterium]
MTTPPHPDDELAGWLASVLTHADPVPERLFDAARAAYGLRDLDARVAELVRDSAVDAPAALVRGDDLRLLSFETGDLVIECEVRRHPARVDVLGQVVGGIATSVTATSIATQGAAAAEDPVEAPVDGQGRFSIRGVPGGVLRLGCRLADGTVVVTSWTPV